MHRHDPRRHQPILDTSVSSLLGEIDEMLMMTPTPKPKQQQTYQYNYSSASPISAATAAATPSRSLEQQYLNQQQFQSQFLQNQDKSNILLKKPISITIREEQHKPFVAASPSPIRNDKHHQQHQQYYHNHDSNPAEANDGYEISDRAVIRSTCQNENVLHQARSLFHYKAWNRLQWHARSQLVQNDDQDPVGHFLEGFACFQQFLTVNTNNNGNNASTVSTKQQQEIFHQAMLSLGKCLVLLSQIDGCDLQTIVWEQFAQDQNNIASNNNGNSSDETLFTVSDVMNLVQMLEEQQQDFSLVPMETNGAPQTQLLPTTTTTKSTTPPKMMMMSNSIIASPRQLETQESKEIEQRTLQLKQTSPSRVVPLPQNSGTSPPQSLNDECQEQFSGKPFKTFRKEVTPRTTTNTNSAAGAEDIDAAARADRNSNNHPNYNGFLEEFIESSLANSEEKLISHRDRMLGTSSTPRRARSERMRMLKKLSSDDSRVGELEDELNKSRSTKTPTADFLARQRGEQIDKTSNDDSSKNNNNNKSPRVKELNPQYYLNSGEVDNSNINNDQPIYMKPVTLPAWVIILLVALSYLGVRSLFSSSSSTAASVSSSAPGSTSFEEGAMPKEQSPNEDKSSSSTNSKKKSKKFGFW